MEGLGSLSPSASAPGFFQPLQSQMEAQLLSDPELMSSLLRSPLVQGALSASSPQLTKQLLLANPLVLQLLQTSPEVADMLDDPDVIAQVGRPAQGFRGKWNGGGRARVRSLTLCFCSYRALT